MKTHSTRPVLILTLLAVGLYTVAPVTAQKSERPKLSIVEKAVEAGSFSTLLTAARAAGLIETLATGKLTLLAPSDEAFAKLPKRTLQSLLRKENKKALAKILSLHVVKGDRSIHDLVKENRIKTLSGNSLTTRFISGRLQIGNAQLLDSDVVCTNGRIHVIDTVLSLDKRVDHKPSTKRASTKSTKTRAPHPKVQRDMTRGRVVRLRADYKTPIKQDGLVADVIELEVLGGGSAILTNVRAREIRVDAKGGSRIQLSGTCDSHVVIAYGGCSLRAADLEAATCELRAYGGAKVEIFASKLLTVETNAGAQVRYAGNPKIKKKIAKWSTFEPLRKTQAARRRVGD